MNTVEIENIVLKELYEWWLANRGGTVYSILPKLDNVEEKAFLLVVDDLEEIGLLKGVGKSIRSEIAASGIFEAEKRGLLSSEIISENSDARSAVIQLAFQTREADGRHADTDLNDVISGFGLNEEAVFRNARLMEELGWIEFRTVRHYAITPFGRENYRQQLEDASGKGKTTGTMVFETTSNSYTVYGILGQGGVGIVYEVSDSDDKTFALKLMRENVLSNEKNKRFRQELEFLKANRHPNLVPVLDDGFILREGKKIPFYVMPRYDGTLGDLIKEKIAPEQALKHFSDMVDGLEALHLKGNFHRDFKPENVLYERATNTLRIGDLGAAHFAAEELFTAIETKNDSRMANFEFAAPEQRDRGRISEVNHLSDIYALGLVLNKMFTGRTPSGEGYPKIADKYSEFAYLDILVTEMIRHSSEDRFQSIKDIKIRLKALEKDFVSLQKLDALRNSVVSSRTPIDSLTATPVEIVGVDFDHYAFRFELNVEVSSDWKDIFKKIDDRNQGLYHAWPQDMEISGNVISVSCTGEAAGLKQSGPMIRDLVTRYVNMANNGYKELLTTRARQMEENQIQAEKEALERRNQEIARIEERRRILDEMALPKNL